MTQQLQTLAEAALSLPLREKLELLRIITSNLQQTLPLSEATEEFWNPRSIEELARMQAAPVVTDIRDLVADFWPEDESADDFNYFIAEQRRLDLQQERSDER